MTCCFSRQPSSTSQPRARRHKQCNWSLLLLSETCLATRLECILDIYRYGFASSTIALKLSTMACVPTCGTSPLRSKKKVSHPLGKKKLYASFVRDGYATHALFSRTRKLSVLHQSMPLWQEDGPHLPRSMATQTKATRRGLVELATNAPDVALGCNCLEAMSR